MLHCNRFSISYPVAEKRFLHFGKKQEKMHAIFFSLQGSNRQKGGGNDEGNHSPALYEGGIRP